MATKKQLAALARGRAIRLAKLRSRVKKRKTNKHTKSLFGLMTGAKTLMYGIGILNGILSTINLAPHLKKSLKQLFSSDNELNTNKMREISANIQRELMMLGIKDNPVYKDIADLNKTIHEIEFYREIGNKEKENNETTNVMTKFKKIMEKYNRLIEEI